MDGATNHQFGWLMKLRNHQAVQALRSISTFHRATTGPQIWAQLPQIRSKHFLKKRAMAGAW